MNTAPAQHTIRINKYRAKKGEQHYIFACHASIPLILTPDLLYHLWNNFKHYRYEGIQTDYKISHLAVPDLLTSGLCKEVAHELFEMDRSVRNYLMADLCALLGKHRRETVAIFLDHYAAIENRFPRARHLRDIHRLTAKSILEPVQMEREIVEKIKAAETEAEKINYFLLHYSLTSPDDRGPMRVISSQVAAAMDGRPLSPVAIYEDDDQQDVLHVDVQLPTLVQQSIDVLTTPPEPASAPMSPPPPTALELIADCKRTHAIRLDLGCCGLQDAHLKKYGDIDLALRDCTWLEILILNNRWQQDALGPFIDSNNKGERNYLQQIPPAITALKKLEVFICGGDDLNGPWSIADLTPLKELRNLHYLDVSFNKLQHFIDGDFTKSLRELRLRDNQLKSIILFQNNSALHSLDLRNNQLSDLSHILHFLQRDGACYALGNPLETPPPEIAALGSKAICQYLEGTLPYQQEKKEFQERLNDLPLLAGVIDRESMTIGFLIPGYVLHDDLGSEWFIIASGEMLLKTHRFSVDVVITYSAKLRIRSRSLVWDSRMGFGLYSIDIGDQLTLNASLPFLPGVSYADPEAGQHVYRVGFSSRDLLPSTVLESEVSHVTEAYIDYHPGTEPMYSCSLVFNERSQVLGIGVNPGQDNLSMRDIKISVISNAYKTSVLAAGPTHQKVARILVKYSPQSIDDWLLLGKYRAEMGKNLLARGLFLSITSLQLAYPIIPYPGYYAINRIDAEIILSTEESFQELQSLLAKETFGPRIVFLKTTATTNHEHSSDQNLVFYYQNVDDITDKLDNLFDVLYEERSIGGQIYIPEPVDVLAVEYEKIRATMPSSPARTQKMAGVAAELRKITPEILPYLPVLTASPSAGQRLAAIAALQKQPDSQYLSWLANRVGDDEKPFIGFNASYALSLAVQSRKLETAVLLPALKRARANLIISDHKDPNQVRLIKETSDHVQFKGESGKGLVEAQWSGYYIQGDKTTNFYLEHWREQGDLPIAGVIRDHGDLGKADFIGDIDLGRNRMSFKKKYRGRSYTIFYSGAMNAGQDYVQGHWLIPGAGSGTFEMKRLTNQ